MRDCRKVMSVPVIHDTIHTTDQHQNITRQQIDEHALEICDSLV